MDRLRPRIQRERKKASRIIGGLGKVSPGDPVLREGKGMMRHAGRGHTNLAKGGPECCYLVKQLL